MYAVLVSRIGHAQAYVPFCLSEFCFNVFLQSRLAFRGTVNREFVIVENKHIVSWLKLLLGFFFLMIKLEYA